MFGHNWWMLPTIMAILAVILWPIVRKIVNRCLGLQQLKKERQQAEKIRDAMWEAMQKNLDPALIILHEAGIWMDDSDGCGTLRVPRYFWDIPWANTSELIAKSLMTVGKGYENFWKSQMPCDANRVRSYKGYEQIAKLLISRAKENPEQALDVLVFITVEGGREWARLMSRIFNRH